MKKTDLVALLENIKECGGVTSDNHDALCQAIDDLKAELRSANNRRNGTVDIAAAANAIIKKGKATGIDALSGAWTMNGRQYVCDLHRIMEIQNSVDLEPIPETATPIKAAGMFNDYELFTEEFKLPTYRELQQEIQMAKAADRFVFGYMKTKAYYKLKDGPALNAEYLLDALRATGAGSMFTRTGADGRYDQPCCFEGSGVRVMLMPVARDMHDGVNLYAG